jgi:polysaccharide pyruvyl transferase WcaK-like protein
MAKTNPWIRAIRSADVAVSLSGGDSFSDIYGGGRLLYVCLPQLLVRMLGKRLILLPQTIGPFNGRVAAQLARSVMRGADAIYCRDFESVQEAGRLLGSHHAQRRLRFCHDLGFLLEPRKPAVLDLGGLEAHISPRHGMLIGLNVSGLLMRGGYDGTNAFRLRANFGDLVDEVVRCALEDQKAKVLLVPHVFGEGWESDTVAARALYERWRARYAGRIFLVQGRYDQSEIKYIIGLCDFFIGSRMHACIAALSQAVPAVAIAYSRKFVGVLRTVDCERLVADPRELTTRQAVQVIERAIAQRYSIRQRLRGEIPEVIGRIRTELAGLL